MPGVPSAVPPVVFTPSSQAREDARLTGFQAWLEQERGRSSADYEELWAWSVSDLEAFWGAVWAHFGVRADGDPTRVLVDAAMPGAVWFPDVRLNWAEHVLDGAGASDDADAVVAVAEDGTRAALTRGELRSLVARAATGLRRLGVGEGDRVVAYLPNGIQALAGLLACAALGATWSSCSPDFGVGSVVDRFSQLEPKVLLAVEGYAYGGKRFDRGEAVDAIEAALDTVEHVVRGAVGWEALCASEEPLTFARVAFDHPLWVLWSSGTTGLPKGLVQGHGGILLEQLKEQALHVDVRPGDRVLWFTTTGWMMWNFLVGCLLHGAAIVLYDGNPGFPGLDRLWQIAADERLTCLGTSASFLAASRKGDVHPAEGRDLAALRAVGSTGSPLAGDDFDWVARELGELWLFSTSGGSDVCTAFVGGNPLLPVHRGELQCRHLGAFVDAFSPEGEPLVGEVGELVLRAPMPSMPVALVGDPDGSRYRDAYFDVYPGVWRHGDWITITDRRTAVLHGRSDATINRGGIRMGTAEIYAAVLGEDAVAEALAVDIAGEEGASRLLLFVVLAEGAALDDALRSGLARRIREQCSPRHVPDDVVAVPALPRTLSGKVLEVPVKRLLEGADPAQVASRDALVDPAALDWFAERAEVLRRG